MRAGDDDRRGAADQALVDVLLRQGHVGAVVAVEDHRRDAFVLDGEEDERRQPFAVDDDAVGRDALAGELFADEAAHLLGADAGDERGLEAEPRGADGDVGGQPPTDLAKEVMSSSREPICWP